MGGAVLPLGHPIALPPMRWRQRQRQLAGMIQMRREHCAIAFCQHNRSRKEYADSSSVGPSSVWGSAGLLGSCAHPFQAVARVPSQCPQRPRAAGHRAGAPGGGGGGERDGGRRRQRRQRRHRQQQPPAYRGPRSAGQLPGQALAGRERRRHGGRADQQHHQPCKVRGQLDTRPSHPLSACCLLRVAKTFCGAAQQ